MTLPGDYVHADFNRAPFTRNAAIAAPPLNAEAAPEVFGRVGVVGVATNSLRALITWQEDNTDRCAWAAPQWLTMLVRDGRALSSPSRCRCARDPMPRATRAAR